MISALAGVAERQRREALFSSPWRAPLCAGVKALFCFPRFVLQKICSAR